VQSENELQQQIADTEAAIQSVKDELARDSRQLDARQNEYNLTKSLVDNLEGFPESIRFLRKNAGWKKQYPLFSDILFCKEDYRVAIENFLEPIMNHYVVDLKEDAVKAINLLSDSSRGRANFFILEAVKQLPAAEQTNNDDSRLISAMDVISVDDKFKSLCTILLDGVYLLKSEDDISLESDL